jgi:2',3'-cyclic-nucleotide 2'-phosphodiesterase (5'-nucleotidase family)
VRQRAPDALVLDAGDALIRDQSPATTSLGASSVELLDMMGYDAIVLGAGDLGRLGVARLRELVPGAQFTTLSANLVVSDTAAPPGSDVELVRPYLIREVQGYAVAVIGLTGPSSLSEVEVHTPFESVRRAVEQAGQEASVLILLSHLGITVNEEIAALVPELDLIVSGGGRGYTPQPFLTDGGPPIVQADMSIPGHAGRQVGVGTWWFDADGQLLGYEWESVPLSLDIPDDVEMTRWMRDNP